MRSIINAHTHVSLNKQQGGTLLGIMVGLIIGIAIAVGVALYINFGPKPFVDRAGVQPTHDTSGQSGPAALPGKPGDAPVEKPKLDFYDILPHGSNSNPPLPPVPQPAANTEADLYYLQLGAFGETKEVDNLKARLALLGMETNIQRIETGGKSLLRVRLGPYSGAKEADTIRAQLIQNGIDSSLIRAKVKTAAP